MYRQLQPNTTSRLDCSLIQKCEVRPGTSQNVPEIARGLNFDPRAFRQYVEVEAVVGTVGKANDRAPFPTQTIELNPRRLAVRT
jgi:hypothetical protein